MRFGILLMFIFGVAVAGGYGAYTYFFRQAEVVPAISSASTVTETPSNNRVTQPPNGQSQVSLKTPPTSYEIPLTSHTYQTFNNCGPATLSMALAAKGKNVSQKELGDKMRPIQNQAGDNDDKAIFPQEFAYWAQQYGAEAIARPNGTIELLKTLTANGHPVVVRTWLNNREDIGHFRLVKGYTETEILFDDSYYGPNRRESYEQFLQLWQPFNYGYILLYNLDEQEKVKAIVKDDFDETKSWENAKLRAEQEMGSGKTNAFTHFNVSQANYYIGDYGGSVAAYEAAKPSLPRRMLWYQIEPLRAYVQLNKFEEALSFINQTLQDHNRAYSELYALRGEIYWKQGNKEAAEAQFRLAKQYNQSSPLIDQEIQRIRGR